MIRFATIGTNTIVDNFLKSSKLCKELEYTTVYSRNIETGEKFASKYGVKKVYTDLADMAKDNEIDAVYVASPNSFHFEHTITMLKHKKHVLCEKPVSSNLREAKIMFETAKENKVILLEALRSVFEPGFLEIENNIKELGYIRRVTFQYCQYSSRYDRFKNGVVENAFNPVFSNGALMDIGVYSVHALVKLFGLPLSILSSALYLENGVDGQGTVIAKYKDMEATLMYSKISNGYIPSEIEGENASMVIKDISVPKEIDIYYKNGEKKTFNFNHEKGNMIYEIDEWVRLIKEKSIDNAYSDFSIMEMTLLDEIRKKLNIVFPADKM